MNDPLSAEHMVCPHCGSKESHTDVDETCVRCRKSWREPVTSKEQLLRDAAADSESEANTLLAQAPNMGPTKERSYRRCAEESMERAKALRAWADELGASKTEGICCKANRTADPPQDCDAPYCGCNPEWTRCIEWLVEAGWQKGGVHETTEVARLRAALYECLNDMGSTAGGRPSGATQSIVDRLYVLLNGETPRQTERRQEREVGETDALPDSFWQCNSCLYMNHTRTRGNTCGGCKKARPTVKAGDRHSPNCKSWYNDMQQGKAYPCDCNVVKTNEQRAALDARLAGRPRKPVDLDEVGTPHLDETTPGPRNERRAIDDPGFLAPRCCPHGRACDDECRDCDKDEAIDALREALDEWDRWASGSWQKSGVPFDKVLSNRGEALEKLIPAARAVVSENES